jgi:hypothetical protein
MIRLKVSGSNTETKFGKQFVRSQMENELNSVKETTVTYYGKHLG